jgi:hypothetical protein
VSPLAPQAACSQPDRALALRTSRRALPEYEEVRLRAGKPKADQVKRTGARVVVAACENCRLQLGDLNRHYGLEVEISALADLVVRAMRSPEAGGVDVPVREAALAT